MNTPLPITVGDDNDPRNLLIALHEYFSGIAKADETTIITMFHVVDHLIAGTPESSGGMPLLQLKQARKAAVSRMKCIIEEAKFGHRNPLENKFKEISGNSWYS